MADTDTTTTLHSREDDTPAADQPPTKRQKLGDHQAQNPSEVVKAPLLPPSHALLGITRDGEPGEDGFTQMLETDVGISEYVGRDISPVQAVIKQRYAVLRWPSHQTHALYLRFTDFLVFEIDQNDRVIRLKSLESPEPPSAPDALNDAPSQESTAPTPQPQITPSTGPVRVPEVTEDVSTPIEAQEGYVWSENFTTVLEKFLSPLVMDKLKQMYEEGPEPPLISDSGWGGRQATQEDSGVTEEPPAEPPAETTSKRGRGRGRGGRGGRGRDRGVRPGKREDNRRAVTEVRTFSLRTHIAKRGT